MSILHGFNGFYDVIEDDTQKTTIHKLTGKTGTISINDSLSDRILIENESDNKPQYVSLSSGTVTLPAGIWTIYYPKLEVNSSFVMPDLVLKAGKRYKLGHLRIRGNLKSING
jgi:hypothetical protein